MDNESEKARPVKSFRVGAMTAAVWKNNGQLSATLKKQYKDGEEWKDTDTLFLGDIVCGIEALMQAKRLLTQ